MPTMKYQDRENMGMPVEAGDYVFGVEKAELGLSKSSGNEQIKLELRIITPKLDGPVIYNYLGFSERQQWVIDVFLKSIKKAPAKGAELDITNEWLQANVVGKMGWARIAKTQYEGKDKNEIAHFITSGKPDASATFESYHGGAAVVEKKEDF